MVAKMFFVICSQAFLIQCTFSQSIGCAGGLGPYGPAGAALPAGLVGPGYPGILAGPYGQGCGLGGVASTGGGFPVTSVSPIAPIGLTIISENAIEGSLFVGGELPFLGTVALEGLLPTAGSGVISYGCGDGAIGIVSESPIATGIVGSAYGPGPVYGPGPTLAGPYGPGLAPGYNGYGCGCGL